jgi:hypothetical protein
MSAWTKFATNVFHQKQKQNSEYKFSQALKEASKLYKKTKGGSSKKQEGGEELQVTGVEPQVTGVEPQVTDAVEKKYSFNEDATDFSEDSKGNLDLENLHNMIELSTGDSVNAMKKKFNELDGVTDEMKFVLNDEVITNDNDMNANDTDDITLNIGGKKSKRKSKKAGKKSQKKQKKAKKSGSKKSKK